MRFPFVWAKTADSNEQMWKAEAVRQRRRAETAEGVARTEVAARRSIAALYSDLCDSHGLPTNDHRDRPGPGQAPQASAAFDQAKAQKAAARIARLQEAVARARAEAAVEGRRAIALQVQLDDALGLNEPAVTAGSAWQGRREQRMRFDQPTAEGVST